MSYIHNYAHQCENDKRGSVSQRKTGETKRKHWFAASYIFAQDKLDPLLPTSRSSSSTCSNRQVVMSSSCTMCVKDTHVLYLLSFHLCDSSLTIINQDIILTFKLHKNPIYYQNLQIAEFQEKDNQELIFDILLLCDSLLTKVTREGIFFQCLWLNSKRNTFAIQEISSHHCQNPICWINRGTSNSFRQTLPIIVNPVYNTLTTDDFTADSRQNRLNLVVLAVVTYSSLEQQTTTRQCNGS